MKSSNQILRALCLVFALLILGCSFKTAEAQNPPPGFTGSCTPNPIYVGYSATCSIHVGGNATGTMSLWAQGNYLGTLPLDSSGNLQVQTGPFNPYPGGGYTAQLTYNPDSNSPYTSATIDINFAVYSGKVVVTADTLQCSPYELYVGNTAGCTVHIPGGATGQVTFSVGSQSQTATLDGNGNASVSGMFAGLPAGTYTLTASYSGDGNFAGFTTTTATNIFSTKPLPSSMSVGCVPAPMTVGATGSCQIQVGGGATGTIDLYVNNQQVASALPLTAGSASVGNLFASLPVGAAAVTANYSGDSNFAPATAGTTLNVVSGEAPPTVTVSCSPEALTINQSGTCTAQLTPGATGTVAFQIDNAPWGQPITVSSSAATTPQGLNTLSSGTHSITAVYSGDANFTPATGGTSLTISPNGGVWPPSQTLTCAPTTIVVGSSTTCTTHVGGGATGGSILYMNPDPYSQYPIPDGEGLDANGNAVFQNVLAGAPAGTYQLAAHYGGDINYRGTGSQPVTIQVVNPGQSPTTNMTASASPSTIQNGGQLSLNVTVAPGATQPVTVSLGNQVLATLDLDSNGSASTLLDFTGPSGNGSYTLTFSYPGDSNIAQATTTAAVTVSGSSVGSGPVAPGSTLYSYSITQPGGTGSGYAPNGNITNFTDSLNGQWSAGYDVLDRIISATVTPVTGSNVIGQSFCWMYDNFGNRTLQARSPNALPQPCAASNGNGENYVSTNYTSSTGIVTNQALSVAGEATMAGVQNATGWNLSYDAAGNTTTDAVNNYAYDGDGRLCAVQDTISGPIYGYLYDAEGHRVAKGKINPPAGTDPCDMTTNGFQLTNEYIPGPNGEQLTELDGNGKWVHTNAFAGAELVATYAANNQGTNVLHFQFADWLGTRRLQTDVNGNPEEICSGGSFGDELNCSLATNAIDASEQHFTGKERDAESGLDYFGARYYGSSMGRMMSPDDFSKDTHVADPQSWNLYAYARNNPLRYTDPTGQTATESSSCSTDSSGHHTCNVSITASIAIYAQSGSGLTQAQLNSAASTIQGSINSAWSGSFNQDGVSYNVSTNVSVSVFGSQDAASGSGAQNVIGISNGDAIPGRADSYVNPRSLGQAIFGGQDTGVWNYNNLGTGVAAHEFTHLLGVGDRSSGAVLSNTNYLNDPSIPHTATANDLRWGVQEATQGANAHYAGGINTPVFDVPPSPNYSGQTTVGAAWHWWK